MTLQWKSLNSIMSKKKSLYLKKKKKITGIVVLSISVILLAFGLMTGGFVDVLSKATIICLECIGIG